MRINIYAEEISNDVEIITKTTPDGEFTGVRTYLYLPVTLPDGAQAAGKFMHHPGDDDSAAITFWGKRDLRTLLVTMLEALDKHYEEQEGVRNHIKGDSVEEIPDPVYCTCMLAEGEEETNEVDPECPQHGTLKGFPAAPSEDLMLGRAPCTCEMDNATQKYITDPHCRLHGVGDIDPGLTGL